MREKWLHQVFDAADSDQKGMLDEWETIALMKKLNDKLCIRSLKQKIMEFEFGKDEEERGRISKKVFITLFTETATRPDIYFILVRYCGRDYMTVEDLQLFLEGEQGVCGLSIEECLDLITKYEPSEEARNNKQLLIDGFTQFLLSEECDIMSVHHKDICHDMSQPLSHYFISTSHNTYLLEDQLKGPSSAEGYARALLQDMRSYYERVFDAADSDQKGMLDEWETIALMKKLNDKLCIRSLKQKIMEFEFGKDEEERGRISKKVFITLFTETATRPDIYFILVRYCGRDYMTVEDLQLFLEGEQGVCGLSIEECLDLITKYEPSEEARTNKQLLIDGFTQFLLSEECDIMSVHHKDICHDMSQPLSHYFISTSHNTYLLEDQLKGPSSAEGYARALLQGCRCVKVDCYDGNDGPVVYHGNTLTSKVALEDVLETIHANAFVVS
ncbi:unnamed protein product, partial [Medioppia subpectinata]